MGSDTDADTEADMEADKVPSKNKEKEDKGEDVKLEKAEAVESALIDDSSSASDSDSEDDALAAARKSQTASHSDGGKKINQGSTQVEKTGVDSKGESSSTMTSDIPERKDAAINETTDVNAGNSSEAPSGESVPLTQVKDGKGEMKQVLETSKPSVEEEFARIKEQAAAEMKDSADPKSKHNQKSNQEKRAEFDKGGSGVGGEAVSFAWDDESGSASSSDSSAEDISSDDE